MEGIARVGTGMEGEPKGDRWEEMCEDRLKGIQAENNKDVMERETIRD